MADRVCRCETCDGLVKPGECQSTQNRSRMKVHIWYQRLCKTPDVISICPLTNSFLVADIVFFGESLPRRFFQRRMVRHRKTFGALFLLSETTFVIVP